MILLHNWVYTIKTHMENIFRQKYENDFIFSTTTEEIPCKVANFTNMILLPTNNLDEVLGLIHDWFWTKINNTLEDSYRELLEMGSTFAIVDEEHNNIDTYIAFTTNSNIYDDSSKLIQKVHSELNTIKFPTNVVPIYFTIDDSLDYANFYKRLASEGIYINDFKYYKTFRVINKVLYKSIILTYTGYADKVKSALSECIEDNSPIYVGDPLSANDISTDKYLGKDADTFSTTYQLIIIPIADYVNVIKEELDNNLIPYDIIEPDSTRYVYMAVHTNDYSKLIEVLKDSLYRDEIKEYTQLNTITIILSEANNNGLCMLYRYQNSVLKISNPEIQEFIDEVEE